MRSNCSEHCHLLPPPFASSFCLLLLPPFASQGACFLVVIYLADVMLGSLQLASRRDSQAENYVCGVRSAGLPRHLEKASCRSTQPEGDISWNSRVGGD